MRFYIILHRGIKILLIVRVHNSIILRVHYVKIMNPLFLVKSSFWRYSLRFLRKSILIKQIRVHKLLWMKQFGLSKSRGLVKILLNGMNWRNSHLLYKIYGTYSYFLIPWHETSRPTQQNEHIFYYRKARPFVFASE